MKVNIVKKGVHKHIDCQCSYLTCTVTIYTDRSEESHKKTTEEYGHGIFQTSAFRCQKHNDDVGGVKNSNHFWGDARDYAADDLDKLEKIARKHWKYVKRYKKFIHCDHRANSKD